MAATSLKPTTQRTTTSPSPMTNSPPRVARLKRAEHETETFPSPKGSYEFERDWVVVVGEVQHAQYHSLTTSVRPQIYLPFQLAPRPASR